MHHQVFRGSFMQTSSFIVSVQHTHHRFMFVMFTLCMFAMTSIWMMQNSINAYYQQTYHQDSPLKALDDYAVWQIGGEIGDWLYVQKDTITTWIDTQNNAVIDSYNANLQPQPQQAIQLHLQDEVFFVGDSLMQGVAPYVQKELTQTYNIKTINLSRQSTGLTYPKLFNWQNTIKQTLQNNPKIKLMVVFLGPNDPWDMQDPQSRKYLSFGSNEWATLYQSRMQDIITTAQQHHVQIMWLTPPNMKKDDLNQKMIFLRQTMQQELQNNHVLSVDTRALLGGVGNTFNEHRMNIKMRTADGIHFTAEGQKVIAHEVLNHLKVVQP